jgi:hypothetical protein
MSNIDSKQRNSRTALTVLESLIRWTRGCAKRSTPGCKCSRALGSSLNAVINKLKFSDSAAQPFCTSGGITALTIITALALLIHHPNNHFLIVASNLGNVHRLAH